MTPKKGPKLPCCGPFAQKQRKLDELDAALKRLLRNVEDRPKVQTAIDRALVERRSLTGWLGAHSCVPPLARGGRATRILGTRFERTREGGDTRAN